MTAALTVGDLLDGHVTLDVQCLDRLYLNGYVPNLQVGGQVAGFMTRHLGYPIPSPAIFDKLGSSFRRAVQQFAETNHVPIVRFGKNDRKIEVMRRHVGAQARTGRSGVAAIGVAQEYQNVFAATEHREGNAVWFSFTKADRRVTCFYFYLWDDDFGPAFITVCAYFPYPVKVWVNGHEWAKRQATHAGIGFTELSNGFATCADPAALTAGDLRPAWTGNDRGVLHPLDEHPSAAVDRRRPGGRLLVGAVDAPGRDLPHHRLGRTSPCSSVLRGPGCRQPRHRQTRPRRLIFTGHARRWGRPPKTEPTYKTRIDTRDTIGVTVNADYKHSRVKQYLKDGRALRIETVINDPGDLICKRRLRHLDELQGKARAVNTRLLDTDRVGQGCVLASPAFERVAQPTLTEDGRRSPALRFGDPRVMALLGALCVEVNALGFTNRSLRARVTHLLGVPYTTNQMSYDLARLRLNGLIQRRGRTNTYQLTPDGQRVAIFYTKVHDRLLRPLLAADQPPAPPQLRAALATVDHHVRHYIDQARIRKAA